MKRFLVMVLVAMCITSCELFPLNEQVDPDTAISRSFATKNEAWAYVANNIWYSHDQDIWGEIDYWQSPTETYELGTGDCEDYAILLMHLFNRLGYDSTMVILDLGGDCWHAVVESGGVRYEPMLYGCRAEGTFIKEYSYSDVMYELGSHTYSSKNLEAYDRAEEEADRRMDEARGK